MEPREQELIILKTIAEMLNQSNELEPVLNTVLEKLLELTGLRTGWIFLSNAYMEYACVADFGLPPALDENDKRPMRCGSCWCLDRFWDGRLKNAVNILSCKRLEDATELRRGDTCGITHHATIPLRAGERLLGVMNVGAPGKSRFTEEELALLQAVAFQIGSAIERTRLYAGEQRRADLYSRLGEFSRALGSGTDAVQLAERAVALIGEHFDWPFAALFEPRGDNLILRTVYTDGRTAYPNVQVDSHSISWLNSCIREKRLIKAAGGEAGLLAEQLKLRRIVPQIRLFFAAAVPVGGQHAGALVLGCSKSSEFDRHDGEVIEALAEHIAAALESARLEEKRRELARLEERNRLARDLHDSVSQMLFSLSMTARGVEGLLNGSNPDGARSAVRDIQSLSQQALKEMRALILQLRPSGLEAGLLSALREYGEKLGLRVVTRLTGVRELPRGIEEALWRIGQEALNNVSKHAGTGEASILLQLDESSALLRIEDTGRGVPKRSRMDNQTSIGLSTMRERAEALGGHFRLTSAYRKGTVVEVTVPSPPPFRSNRGEQNNEH
ncbi:MAG: histidine kinase [Paenibacillus sp.]|nr:histidine kinase [Paenibacillus sp.]